MRVSEELNELKKRKAILFGIAFLICLILVAGGMYLKSFISEQQEEARKTALLTRNQFKTELFGENMYIFSPEDPVDQVQEILDDLWNQQETNQFGNSRYGVYFLPGTYHSDLDVKVGYYMEIAGLSKSPEGTIIPALNCSATWLGDENNHNATCNFWRGVSNLTIDSDTMWAVSQATFMRRVHIKGNLELHDNYGWASGGFLADSKIDQMVDSGSQQQWLSRNCDWGFWLGENWNMVFVGLADQKAPKGKWPGTKNTTVEETPIIREKPFLYYDDELGYQVFVPDIKENSKSISWEQEDYMEQGKSISIEDFYVAKSDVDTAETINAQLAAGKHLLLTPGIYHLSEPIRVENENTIVLGIGLATLMADQGTSCMEVSDVDGVILAGILFDAGENESKSLLQLGTDGSNKGETPTCLSDLFFRVGGNEGYTAKTENCVVIDQNQVIGDNFWVWRADHGDNVAWDLNTAKNGIIVNGNDVTIYALMVEHFQEYQTIWNGENGRVYFYQSEIPYDVPSQDVWMSHDGTVNGYASYKVSDQVKNHEAWGLGIYSFHRDAQVDLFSAMEVPNQKGVKIHQVCAIMITGNPGISHVINDQGDECKVAGDRKIIVEYENGIQK